MGFQSLQDGAPGLDGLVAGIYVACDRHGIEQLARTCCSGNHEIAEPTLVLQVDGRTHITFKIGLDMAGPESVRRDTFCIECRHRFALNDLPELKILWPFGACFRIYMAQDTDGRLLYLEEQHGVFNGLAADDRIFGKGIWAGGVKMLGKNSGLANLSGTACQHNLEFAGHSSDRFPCLSLQ